MLNIPARSYGGALRGVVAQTIHSMECPMTPGYAESLARNWFATSKAGTSAHYGTDPAVTVQMVPTDRIAYHCGPNGNGKTLGYEQAGYARQSRAQWLTDLGMAQLRLLAAVVAADALKIGNPIRRASVAELRAAIRNGGGPVGLCSHNDIRLAVGGTTHTDPGDQYPWDVLVSLAQKAAAQLSGATTTEDDMDALQNQYLGEVRYQTLATIAPNVLSTNGAVAGMAPQTQETLTKVRALEAQIKAQGDLLAKIAKKVGA